MEVNVQLNASAALPPGKRPRCRFYTGLGGPQSRSKFYGEEKNLLPLPGIESRPISTELSRRKATKSELPSPHRCNRPLIAFSQDGGKRGECRGGGRGGDMGPPELACRGR
jgi:hypothetical protein